MPPMQGLNVEYGGMDNYCRVHKQNHSKRKCQVFINLYGSPAQPSTQAVGQPTITKIKGDIEDEGQKGEIEEHDTQPQKVMSHGMSWQKKTMLPLMTTT